MIECLNCHGTNFEQFFEEEIPCHHCSEVNVIEYVVCTDCNFVAKVCEGNILNGVLFAEEQHEFINQDIDDLVRSFEQAAAEIEDDVLYPPKSMSDMVHKCIRCETTSFEKEPGLFHCPECGFEWEIIKGV